MPAKIQQKIWNSVTLSKENNRIPTNDEDFLRKIKIFFTFHFFHYILLTTFADEIAWK